MAIAVAAVGILNVDLTYAETPVENFTAEVEATIIDDAMDANGNVFDLLDYPSDMSIISINDRHYALITNSYVQFGSDGMQVIDITNPARPLAVASITGNGTNVLHGFMDVSTITVDDKLYSVTTGYNNTRTGGVQIMDITNPAEMMPVHSFLHRTQDTAGNTFAPLTAPSDIAATVIDGVPYAIVSSSFLASAEPNGIQIINMSNPADPLIAKSIFSNERDAAGQEYTAMQYPIEIDTITIDGKHYVLILGANLPTGTDLEIINISDPTQPLIAANLESGTADVNGAIFGALHYPLDLSTATIADRHYVFIVHHLPGKLDNSGVEIVDITDPTRPQVIKNISVLSKDSNGRTFEQLAFAKDIKVVLVDDRYYALVLGSNSSVQGGIEIIDVTNPADPLVAGAIIHGMDDANGETFHFDRGEDINVIIIDGVPHVLVTYTNYNDKSENGVQILKLSHMPAPGTGPAPSDALESRVANLEMLLADLRTAIADLTAKITALEDGMPDPAQALLSGIVYMDANGNDRYDSGEAGVPGLGVIAVDLSDHSSTTTAVTDSDGMYAFDGLDSGSYLVQIVGYDIYNYVTIPAGQSVTQNFAFP